MSVSHTRGFTGIVDDGPVPLSHFGGMRKKGGLEGWGGVEEELFSVVLQECVCTSYVYIIIMVAVGAAGSQLAAHLKD